MPRLSGPTDMCGWLQIDSEENEGMNFENDRPAPVSASSKHSSVFCLLGEQIDSV
jgi:hypothetical protein